MTRSQTYYLFRHGLATHSLDGYGDKTLTAGLLPEAYPAIEQLAAYLSQFAFDLRLVSPVLRCQQTAAVVSQVINQEFVTDERVIEYWPRVFAPFQQRITELASNLQQHPAQHIAICTHGAVIAGLAKLLQGQEFTEADVDIHPQPAGLVIITTDLSVPITTHLFGG